MQHDAKLRIDGVTFAGQILWPKLSLKEKHSAI